MRWSISAVALATILIGLAGCTGNAGTPQGEIPFETLDQGAQSGIEQEHTQTVRSQEDWEQLYDRHAPDEEPPAVDFDEKMVLTIFKGESPDACHGAEITDVVGESEDQIRVEGEFFEVQQAACAEVVTYPYHFVEIDRYEADVTYHIEQTQREGESEDESLEDSANSSEKPVPLEDLEQGDQSEIKNEHTQTVRTQSSWENLYRRHAPDREPPEVDFDESMVHAIFKGKSPNGCHGAEITDVTLVEDRTLLVEGEFYVETETACTDSITYPFHIVETDRYDTGVRYDIKETERS